MNYNYREEYKKWYAWKEKEEKIKLLNSTLFDNISSKFSQNKYKRHDKKYDFI